MEGFSNEKVGTSSDDANADNIFASAPGVLPNVLAPKARLVPNSQWLHYSSGCAEQPEIDEYMSLLQSLFASTLGETVEDGPELPIVPLSYYGLGVSPLQVADLSTTSSTTTDNDNRSEQPSGSDQEVGPYLKLPKYLAHHALFS